MITQPRPHHPAPVSGPRLGAWLAVGLLVLAGCSASPSASASGSPLGGPGETVTVTITGTSFGPDLTILAGTAVVFQNDAGVNHTVTNGTSGTANEDALFDQAVSAGAASDPIVFDDAGTYDVTCKIHSSMHLIIDVT